MDEVQNGDADRLSHGGSGLRRRSRSPYRFGSLTALPRVLAAAAGLAMGEVEGQQVLGEGAVGGRLVSGRVVGTDAAWDRFDDHIVVRPEEEWAGVIAPVLRTNVPGTAGGLIQSPSAVRTSRPGSFDCARNVMKLLSVCGANPNSLSSGDGCGG